MHPNPLYGVGLPQRFSDHYFRAVSAMISRHATRLPVAAINVGGLFQQLSGSGLPAADYGGGSARSLRFNSSQTGRNSRQESGKLRVSFDSLIDADGCHPRPLAHALIAEAVTCLLLRRTGFESSAVQAARSVGAAVDAAHKGAALKPAAARAGVRRRAEQRAPVAVHSAAREPRKSRTDVTVTSAESRSGGALFFPLFSAAHCCRGGAAVLPFPLGRNVSGIHTSRSGITSGATQAQCEEACSSTAECLFYSYSASSGMCSLCASCSRCVIA